MSGFLKRKRSDSEMSFSSSTTLSSPPRPIPELGSPASPAFWKIPSPPMLRGRDAMSHLPGRTLKRYRNNRPSEAEVHEHTLNLLYTAQQIVRQQPPAVSEQDVSLHDDMDRMEEDDSQPGFDNVAANQPSLHSFWGSARGSKPDSMAAGTLNTDQRASTCNASALTP
ncbi:hypothetical protein SBRCBS47491_006343 [Sporothrix bragantina]|uniref:Uncharacterized protein n=1 Tax=Sporothrix bragantina TaxID=671064 RepID=A0ABP0C557_9PEZI